MKRKADAIQPGPPGIESWRKSAFATLKRHVLAPIAARRERTMAVVIDPGLLMESGHSYSALLRLKAELSKLDVEHTCLASLTADATVRQLAAPVLPNKGLWWRSSYTRSEFLKHVEAMTEQLSTALNDQTRPPDLLILDCCDSVQIAALAEYYGRPSPIPAPHLLLWLLLRPNLSKPIGDPSAAAQIDEYREAFTALRRAIGNDKKITIFCETASLAAAYTDILGLEVGVAPCPNLVGVGGKDLRKGKSVAGQTLKIATLGHANEAKGYHLLPAAIEHVLDADNRATFFIHGTLENSDATGGPAVFDALSRMGPRVVTSNEALSAPDYLSRLLEADILLLPYDSHLYETRGSGLFNEAREIGIPIVATRGCVFAQPAFDEGWGIEIVERSGRGIAQAILSALQRLPDLSARAQEAAAIYRANDAGTILGKIVNDVSSDERSVRAAAVKRARKEQSLGEAFFTGAFVQEGASVRLEGSAQTASSSVSESSAIASIVGKLVDTTSVPYLYSVVLSTDGATGNLPPGSPLIAKISIEVLAGQVGVLWIDENHQVVDDTERYAPAMPGIQRLVVSAAADQGRQLVFRNFAHVPASFRILELRAATYAPK